jgi:hypothetical protein
VITGVFAPRVRLELTTLRLTAECSTIELPRNIGIPNLAVFSFYVKCFAHSDPNYFVFTPCIFSIGLSNPGDKELSEEG